MEETKQRLIDSHPEYAKAIGTISVEMVHLEITLSMALALILCIPTEMADAIFFSPTSTGPRLAILRNAAKKIPDKFKHIRDIAEDLVSRATKCQNRRNDIVHSAWVMADDGHSISTSGMPLNFKGVFDKHNIQELYNLIERIRATDDVCDQLIETIIADKKYPPWRRKRA
jgi:hypothetical protein